MSLTTTSCQSRRIDYATDQPTVVIQPGRSWGKPFVVEQIRETLKDGIYSVTLAGPIQTSTGKRHKTNRGNRDFGDEGDRWSRPESLLADIPETLRPLLVGRAEMIRYLVDGIKADIGAHIEVTS